VVAADFDVVDELELSLEELELLDFSDEPDFSAEPDFSGEPDFSLELELSLPAEESDDEPLLAELFVDSRLSVR
jgi:hypothetical protein